MLLINLRALGSSVPTAQDPIMAHVFLNTVYPVG